MEGINNPDSLKKEVDADVVIDLRAKQGGISEIWVHVWYLEDGIAIIKSPMDNYKVIPKEKTDRLKAFILDTGIDLDSLVPRIDTDDSNSE